MKLSDVNLLATYNAECARGLLHNEKWQERMRLLQEQFDCESKSAALAPNVYPPFFMERD